MFENELKYFKQNIDFEKIVVIIRAQSVVETKKRLAQ